MQASSGPSGEALLAIAALAAIQLTAGESDAQAHDTKKHWCDYVQ